MLKRKMKRRKRKKTNPNIFKTTVIGNFGGLRRHSKPNRPIIFDCPRQLYTIKVDKRKESVVLTDCVPLTFAEAAKISFVIGKAVERSKNAEKS